MLNRFVSFFPLAALTGVVLLAAGCSNCDLVEAELRSRESELDHLRSELYRTECANDALQREIRDMRQSAFAIPSPELASQTYTIRQIVLGRQTGGYDEDDCPGDEALQVVLEPRDGDGHALKAPGALRVVAVQISPEGLKAPLSSWDLSPDELRRTWRSGLLTTGYHVILPWKAWPASNRLRVIAQFTLADGRVFEADKDVTVRLPPPAYRKPAAGAADEPGPDLLPPPRQLRDPGPGAIAPSALWNSQPGRPVQLLRPARLP